ncbi:hypothetical protein CBL_01965 [Carabus blaptoides fortunei]
MVRNYLHATPKPGAPSRALSTDPLTVYTCSGPASGWAEFISPQHIIVQFRLDMLVQADFIPYGYGAVLEHRLGGSRAHHTVTEPCGSSVRVALLRAPSLSTTSIVVHTTLL